MPIRTRILPSRNIVYVRQEGVVCPDETLAAVDAYMRHPDYLPGHHHLADMEAATGIKRDFVKVMKMTMGIASVTGLPRHDVKMVLYAPNEAAQRAASVFRKSWDGLGVFVTSVTDSEDGALSILGQPEQSIAAFLHAAQVEMSRQG